MKSIMLFLAALLVALVMAGCGDSAIPTAQQDQDSVLSGLSEAAYVQNQSNNHNFRTSLKGENEVPAVETRAQGQAIFQLSRDGSELSYKLIVANIENVTMAHIHLAPANENGPVVVWLYPDGFPPQLIPGRFSGVLAEGVITDADIVGETQVQSLDNLIEQIRAGNAYVNVHTSQYPPGEIRGQIF